MISQTTKIEWHDATWNPVHVHSRVAGHLLDGREWSEMPEVRCYTRR